MAPITPRTATSCAAVGRDAFPERAGVVTLVAVENTRSGQAVEKLFRRLAIGDLAAGQQERDRAAEVVWQGVDFR